MASVIMKVIIRHSTFFLFCNLILSVLQYLNIYSVLFTVRWELNVLKSVKFGCMKSLSSPFQYVWKLLLFKMYVYVHMRVRTHVCVCMWCNLLDAFKKIPFLKAIFH
jgi:hypothetical protein